MVRDYLEAALVAAVFWCFATTWVVKTFYIPSGSMEETLLVGDHLFVNRFVYGGRSPLERLLLPSRPMRRGDVVVFRSPEQPELDVVKRCIGLAGDVIELRGTRLSVNGRQVDESAYARYTDPFGHRDRFGPVRVPPGHYFCLGDNRDNSNDSRYWGPLPAHLVRGRAVAVYWSYGGETPDGGHAGLLARLRRLAATAVGFARRTRWERTFHLIR